MTDSTKTKRQPKQYFERVPRKTVYGLLLVFAVCAALLFLCVPHYKPLKLASDQQIQDAHHNIIKHYFLSETNCENDSRDRADRIKTFNKYFKVNQYANRAVFRGCNDNDKLLAQDDAGKWQYVAIDYDLDYGLLMETARSCQIQDIVKQNHEEILKIDHIGGAEQLPTEDEMLKERCDSLAKESYIEVNLKSGIHFHF
jgi:hypothetical protein